MSTITPEFMEIIKASATDAQAASVELRESIRRGEQPSGEILRRINHFNFAAQPAVVLEIIKRMEELQALSDKAIKIVGKAKNQAIELAEAMDRRIKSNGGTA